MLVSDETLGCTAGARRAHGTARTPVGSMGQQQTSRASWHSPMMCCSPWEHAEKIHPELFLWSQWITHVLKAVISLAGQIVFHGFHPQGREVVSADRLSLFSDRKQSGAARTQSQLCANRRWKLPTDPPQRYVDGCEGKTRACLCPANPDNFAERVLTSSTSGSFPAAGAQWTATSGVLTGVPELSGTLQGKTNGSARQASVSPPFP